MTLDFNNANFEIVGSNAKPQNQLKSDKKKDETKIDEAKVNEEEDITNLDKE